MRRAGQLQEAPRAGQNAATVGFFNNPKRFNVAITRAQALLVVVGHPGMLKKDRQWGHLVRAHVDVSPVGVASIAALSMLATRLSAAHGQR